MKKALSVFLMAFASNSCSGNNHFKSIYIDTTNHVHIVFPDGRDKQISSMGHAAHASLAPDQRSAAWLVLNTGTEEGDAGPGASQLAIYANNRLRHIHCEPFIRDYWFWKGGTQVAIDYGGRHFAGIVIVYDAQTLQKIESVFPADLPEDRRPAWSRPESNGDAGTVQ